MPLLATDPLPVISVAGTPREVGAQHGELLRDRIELAVEQYLERFDHFADLDRAAARREARRYIEPIREFDSEILEEIEGIADGAGLALEDVLAINCRSELMFGTNLIMECSSFGLQPSVTETGHTYVGQNWDWAPDIQSTLAIVAIRQESPKPDVVILDEAGVVGRMGFNSDGIGLCTNTLIADQERPSGVPYNVLLRGVLNSRRLDDALGGLIRRDRAICSNHMIGDGRGQTIDVELTPDQYDYIAPSDGIVVHGNHFAGPRLMVRDRSVEKWPDSLYRECRIRELLSARAPQITVADTMTALSDRFGHPNAVCRHADESAPRFDQLQTVASIVVDCRLRECWIAPGPPDVADYTHFTLESFGLPAPELDIDETVVTQR